MSIYPPKLKEFAKDLVNQEWHCSWRIIDLLQKHFADLPQEKTKEFYEELCYIIFNCITKHTFTVDDFADNKTDLTFQVTDIIYSGAVILYKNIFFTIATKHKTNGKIKAINISYHASSDFCKYFEGGKYYEGEI
jgi:hypothetical protein